MLCRRELSLGGKNRVFVNDQLVTQAFLKKLGPRLADIHGQGDQSSLYDVETHIAMLDDFANVVELKTSVGEAFRKWVDDPAASAADLDALARADEDAWRAEREAVLLYPC